MTPIRIVDRHGRLLAACLAAAWLPVLPLTAAEEAGDFLGRWALTIPGGGAGWLEITREDGWFDGSILWGGGSVVPLDNVFFHDGRLHATRLREVKRKLPGGGERVQRVTELLTARVAGDQLELRRVNPRDNGEGVETAAFSGTRIPPLPPRPDLAAVRFGEPVVLFNGRDLAGWRLVEAGAPNGWQVLGGNLANRPGQPHQRSGNLRTEAEFEDFNLRLECMVPPRGNSGVYLRGIYEVQVADSHGQPPNAHGMGGLYSRITPTANPSKAPGEWQSLDITLVDRHLTVILNGVTIIDNQPVAGCTGGALWSDEFRPGPILLQGDHGPVDYRNLVLRPVLR
ncbi:MAG: DUF1080 domain-containing protein [Akkermansiaceae bacterium]|jgi:hypothetical protein|nr:DUF1080 domain-containing protein [Akkermansiaceae bacterium]